MTLITALFNITHENVSAQRGDLGFFVGTQSSGSDENISTNNQQPILIGPIVNIYKTASQIGIVFEIQGDTWIGSDATQTPMNNIPDNSSFLMFAKNNAVNVASILGYYGIARFKNNSLNKAELYAASCEIVESSK